MAQATIAQTATLPDIRANVVSFVKRWTGEKRERAEKDTFWNEFFEIFGVNRRRVGAVFEYAARRYSTGNTGFMDLFWPRYIAVEHKSRGQDLEGAMGQLVDYLPAIPDIDLPQLLVVCDFYEFVVRDVDARSEIRFPLDELPQHVEEFAFLAGHSRTEVHINEEAANLEATRLLASLHDRLSGFGYPAHELRILLTRLLFVLFADDTALWPRHLFEDYMTVKAREDGSDLGARLNELFELLDTPEGERLTNLDPTLAEFPYVNGGLFAERLRGWTGDRAILEDLLHACGFQWARISPAIFGSLFQNVMDAQERRSLGAHYTSERDILRTIQPLFLDELEQELFRAKTGSSGRLRRLHEFHDKLRSLTFFDPACGCGNFLLIAFRELRRLELETLLAIRDNDRRTGATAQVLDIGTLAKVNAGQFFGIEIEEFPARIAETAVHLVDHLANMALSEAFGAYFIRLPIKDSAKIVVGDALTVDWRGVVPTSDCTYILSNPPFSGISQRTVEQTEELKAVWGIGYHGSLDYVTGWYRKAIDYVGSGTTHIALVSTNSVSQGEQVAPLWGAVLAAGFSIDFAHQTFAWTSEAAGRAAVHVVIIGFSRSVPARPKILYQYANVNGEPMPKQVTNISPYLIEGPSVVVSPQSLPLGPDLPEVQYGSKPSDGGHLIVELEDYKTVIADPIAAKYVHPYVGAREIINGQDRWCLWLKCMTPGDLGRSQILAKRVAAVREFRSASRAAATREYAESPTLFRQIGQPTTNYLAIPRHVSETRKYFTVGYYGPEVIASDAAFVAADPDGLVFAVISSSIFITWLRAVGGRIKHDLRFSKLGVWNTLPLPKLSTAQRSSLGAAGAEIQHVRERYPDSSLADLYAPNGMPVALKDAHRGLDRVADRIIAGRRRIQDNDDRLSILFERYIGMKQVGQSSSSVERSLR